MSHDQTIGAIFELLAERWPSCFAIFEKHRRPLKIGIHNDILAALEGAVTEAELKRALRVYVSNRVYRSRLVAGAARIGLAGEPAGTVTEQQEAARPAVARAAKAPSIPAAPPAKMTTTGATPRLSLADLRAAALQRKAASDAGVNK